MNDRFKFRLPFYNNDGEFSHFQYIDIVDGLKPYNAGVMFHRGEYEQCSGLSDKNGKLIYDGDIVYDSMYENNFVVSWDNDRTGYILSANNTNHIDYLSKILIERHNLKIIGNIHKQAEQKD